jgi:hypothetical protein
MFFHSAVQRMRVSAAGIPMKINRLAKSGESICPAEAEDVRANLLAGPNLVGIPGYWP